MASSSQPLKEENGGGDVGDGDQIGEIAEKSGNDDKKNENKEDEVGVFDIGDEFEGDYDDDGDFGQEEEEIKPDPCAHWLIPGLYRTIRSRAHDVSDEIDVEFSDVHFPKKQAYVEVTIEGKQGENVIYPERTLEYFIGDGFLEGLPFGVDAALTFFRRGESSMLTITDPALLKPIFCDLDRDYGYRPAGMQHVFSSDLYSYCVTLNKFENLPEIPEEYSFEDRLILCERLIKTAKKLCDVKEYIRAILKYDFVQKNMDNVTIHVLEIPQEISVKKMVLQLSSLIGMAQCLLTLEDSNTLEQHNKMSLNDIELVSGINPLVYINKALAIKPDSIEALQILGEIHFKHQEPQNAMDAFNKVCKFQKNHEGIGVKIFECTKMLKRQKAEEIAIASRMLKLNLEQSSININTT